MNDQHRILMIGDSYMNTAVFEAAFTERGLEYDSATISMASPTWSTVGLNEFEGDPAEVDALLDGHTILAIHAAPISDQVLARNASLQLIGCARGGPVNVDLEAARAHGVKVTTTPGKNADAVADLTIGFLIQALRNVPAALADVDRTVSDGGQLAESTFEGARWFGRELNGRTLGLIGYGNVARLVARRARALGMRIRAFDPFVSPESVDDAEIVPTLDELLSDSEVISIHARATAENRHLLGAEQFGKMREGSILINTARESLVDERALLQALASGHLAGAAMDVNEPDGPWRELVSLPNVVLTPHIAGATYETLRRGASMLADEIVAFTRGEALRWER